MNFKELYPLEESPRVKWMICLLVGAFIFGFLWVFQPFGISFLEEHNKFLEMLGFGLISTGVCFLHYFLYQFLFPNYFDNRNWTVGKEILNLLLLVFTIAVLNYYYLKIVSTPRSFLPNFPEMVLETLVIGVFPISGMILTNYIYQLKKYSELASSMPIRLMGQNHEWVQPLVLWSESQTEKLILDSKDLLYLEAKSNYVEINFFKENEAHKRLLRSTLRGMEDQIQKQVKGNSSILKCHRSFIVHLGKVSSIKGNA